MFVLNFRLAKHHQNLIHQVKKKEKGSKGEVNNGTTTTVKECIRVFLLANTTKNNNKTMIICNINNNDTS